MQLPPPPPPTPPSRVQHEIVWAWIDKTDGLYTVRYSSYLFITSPPAHLIKKKKKKKN